MTDVVVPPEAALEPGPVDPALAGGPPPLDAGPVGEAPPPLVPRPPEPVALPVRFTGRGGEYFRIWIVNLLLTILTLGIYSAWAKVRRTRWFWANTQVGGAAFQYHGNPVAILRGRILVGLAFGAYTLAGRFSVGAAVVAAVLLGVVAPWLFLKAIRFKLTNTTWRGIRFGFESTVGEAYAALTPAVVLWVLLTAASSTIRAPAPGERPAFGGLLAVYALIFIFTPLLHDRYKRWQHGAATCGALRFGFQPSAGAFYGLYGKTFLVGVVPFTVIGVAFGVLFALFKARTADLDPSMVAGMAGAYVVVLVAYLVPSAYFMARVQRLVWTRTQGGPLRFDTRVAMWRLLGVWLKNGLLTVLTLGLYWPFAAVAITRYQVECMTVYAAGPLEAVTAGPGGVEASATGDGAVDFLGWDFGL